VAEATATEVFVLRHSGAARRVRLIAADSGPAVTAKDLLCDFSAILYNWIEQATKVVELAGARSSACSSAAAVGCY
jgi:hypothetical protein